ncbi:MAG: sensor signal transduction histidine kinase [Acidimicrobiales bacterium]|nr:sensor signal transduction histidine kinase [Acidimicrobiales bacterium]
MDHATSTTTVLRGGPHWARIVGIVAPFVALLVGTVATFAAADVERERHSDEIKERIDPAVADVRDQLRSRLDARVGAAEATAAVLSLAPELTRDEFVRFAAQARARFPDVSGMGYIRQIRAGLATAGSGVPHDLAVVRYEEPAAPFRSAGGVDLLGTPAAEALTAATERGAAVVSSSPAPIVDRLLPRASRSGSYIIYAPVFAAGAPIASPTQRRAAVVGWSSLPFGAQELVEQLRLPKGINVAIHDDSRNGPVARAGQPGRVLRPPRTLAITVADRSWKLVVTPTHHLAAGLADRTSAVLGIGLALTMVLACLVASLASGNRQWTAAAKRALRSLVASEERLRATIASAPDLILVIDREGTISSASQRAVDLLGVVPEYLVGRKVDELIPGWSLTPRRAQPPVWPDDALSAIRADGMVVPVEVDISPLRPDDDRSQLIAIIRDVSLRRRVEADRALLSSIVSSTQDPILALSLDGTITSWNPGAERLYGWRAEEAVGQPIALLVPEEHQAEMTDALHQVALGESVNERLTRHRRRDGSVVDVVVALSPLRGLPGEPDGASLITHDMTSEMLDRAALASYAADLERSNRDLEEFASIVSHDLSEPLRVVGGYVGLLTHRYTLGQPLDGRAIGYLGAVAAGVERMRQLIEGLLEFSRLREDVQELGPVNLAVVTDAALANLTTAIEEAHATIDVGPLPTVLGDQAQLLQLVQNLVANAIRFRDASRPPEILITAEPNQTQSHWTVSVKDNGIGIPPQHQDQIFAMFRRLHRSDQFTGMGIGLAVCRRVVDLHGGELRVESSVGNGSTFIFTLEAAGGVEPVAAEQEVANA